MTRKIPLHISFQDVNIPIIEVSEQEALSLDQMKLLDLHAVDKYHLPIELMMENAGYHLARIVSQVVESKSVIAVGCGKGNNGGGGLVAARHLLAWGHEVYLNIPDDDLKPLPKLQLKRALSFGGKLGKPATVELAIDAYFGFSFRNPMPEAFSSAVEWMNALNCPVISLDLPSGLTEKASMDSGYIVNANAICTLAAPKKILFSNKVASTLFIVDIGIPVSAFIDLDLPFVIDFSKRSTFKIQNSGA